MWAGSQLGDVIQLHAHPTVPADLVGKYLRVTAITETAMDLSQPYWDRACTVPFTPGEKKPPRGVLVTQIG